ncbi:MAG: hypothetical protein PHF00_10060, partial [Elusimicrobia bacterium]|nr:hypothetical protein [Elusimicrobiota bacterium]
MSILSGLRRKNTPAPAGAPKETDTPAYYEVWGGMESANRALWAALWFASTVALLAIIMVRALMCRPPIVIRVDAAGQALAADAGRQPPVSEAEIKNFLMLFEKFFTELNCYTHDADLKIAFSMMAPEFQGKANDIIKMSGVVENIKAVEGKTVLTLTEMKVAKDTPRLLECQVKGYRRISSYKQDVPASEVVFE